MKQAEIAFVILNFNTYKKTRSCILSCLKQKEIKAKILLIDNHSTDGSYEKLVDEFSEKIDTVQYQDNYGYAKANNLGVDRCYKEGIPYCFILNSDTELIGDKLTRHLLDSFSLDTNIAVSAPHIYNVTKNGNVLNTNDSRYLTMLRALGILPKLRQIDNSHILVSEAHGSAFIIKSEIFKKVGGLEESYFMYGEESHMCKKIQQMNQRIVWYQNNNEFVLHHHDTSEIQEEWRVCLNGRNRTLEYYEERKNAPIRWTLAFMTTCFVLWTNHSYGPYFDGVKIAKKLHSENATKSEILCNALEIRDNKGK